jgi:hypothetical protein
MESSHSTANLSHLKNWTLFFRTTQKLAQQSQSPSIGLISKERTRNPCSIRCETSRRNCMLWERRTSRWIYSVLNRLSEPRDGAAFCPTSKMSHDLRWRGSCDIKIWILLFHFDNLFRRTRRDSEGRWLWRLVGPFRVDY